MFCDLIRMCIQHSIDCPIQSAKLKDLERMYVESDAQSRSNLTATGPCLSSLSLWKTLGTCPYRSASLLALQPITGRKHQLRLHCSSILKCSIIGDSKYARVGAVSKPIQSSHMMLHARALRFRHPFTHEMISVNAPVPIEFTQLAQRLRIKVPDEI